MDLLLRRWNAARGLVDEAEKVVAAGQVPKNRISNAIGTGVVTKLEKS